jgi:uncharacterized protein YqeY
MKREELMKEAVKGADPIKKSLYKLLVSELDRVQDYSEKSLINVVRKMIKSTKLLHQDDVTRYEIKLLQEFLPKPIDLDEEFKVYINNATSDKSIGGVMKYFKATFDGRYDGKELSTKAKKYFQKDYPKRVL